jgi:hypothetical protein
LEWFSPAYAAVGLGRGSAIMPRAFRWGVIQRLVSGNADAAIAMIGKSEADFFLADTLCSSLDT